MAAISTQSHSFSPQLAAEYGIEEAILINYFQHWITKNRARERHFYDGCTWMYETQEDMAANFLYMNHFKVFRTIKSLIKKGVLKSGNYNKNRYDQTRWYAFVEEEKFIGNTGRLQKCKIDVATSQNGNCENATPIPVTIPITYTQKETDKEKGGQAPPPPSLSLPRFTLNQITMAQEDYDKLCEQFGADVVKAKLEELDDYSRNTPKKFKEYKCHATTIRQWIRRDQKNGLPRPAKASDSNRAFLENVRLRCQHRNDMTIGPDSVSFHGINSQITIKITDGGFKDQVIKRLRLMKLPVDDL